MPNRNTHYFVRNLVGTSKNKCGCRSWIKHWRRYTKSTRTICAVVGCHNLAVVGAHVEIDDYRFNCQWWIVPFCPLHNNHNLKDPLALKLDVELVSANKHFTCKVDF